MDGPSFLLYKMHRHCKNSYGFEAWMMRECAKRDLWYRWLSNRPPFLNLNLRACISELSWKTKMIFINTCSETRPRFLPSVQDIWHLVRRCHVKYCPEKEIFNELHGRCYHCCRWRAMKFNEFEVMTFRRIAFICGYVTCRHRIW